MDEFLKARNTAIEITAAGIVDANVSPTFKPRYTFAAVNTSVTAAPRSRLRAVSSTRWFTALTLARPRSYGLFEAQSKARNLRYGLCVSPVILACLKRFPVSHRRFDPVFDRPHSDLLRIRNASSTWFRSRLDTVRTSSLHGVFAC